MKIVLIILLAFSFFEGKTQKVDSIYFNLYTDSLKKGVYNYINVDGKTSTGDFLPLTADEVQFSSTSGRWEGNNLIFDTASAPEKVTITACLKKQQSVKKSISVYLKKVELQPELKSEQEVINEYKKQGRNRKS